MSNNKENSSKGVSAKGFRKKPVTASEQNAQMLLQTVLKEAFSC